MYDLKIAGEEMYQMKKLRSELGDVHNVLTTIHKTPARSASLGQCHNMIFHCTM